MASNHTPPMVRRDKFLEFILPYMNKVFKRYKGTLRIWHNEGKVGHILSEVDKIDAEVWHFGPFDCVTMCKEKLISVSKEICILQTF